MPVQFGTLVKAICDKVGIATDDKSITDLLAINATIGEEAFNIIKGGLDKLMDENAAKNNDTLHKHFKALSLAPLDKIVETKLDELGLDDAAKAEFKANPNSYEKIKKLVDKAIELEAAKHKSKDGDKAGLQQEIQRLNGEITKLKDQSASEVRKLQEEHQAKVDEIEITSMLRGKQYAQKDLPIEVNVLTARNLVNTELASKGAKAVRQPDGSFKLVRADNPELDYMENHKPVTYDAFVDSALAKHKMLQVSDSTPPGPGKTRNKTVDTPPADQLGAAVAESNSSNLAALESSLG